MSSYISHKPNAHSSSNTPANHPVIANENCSLFTPGSLIETASPNSSAQICWWLDSGGIFTVENGIGKTIIGNLQNNSYIKIRYSKSNPIDTNNGSNPQNIFRLINKKKWQNVSQSVLFKIDNYNTSSSSNRNISNGVLLMSHYKDSDNLYYAGVRVDGFAVIKKKINGKYTTLAIEPYINLDESNSEKSEIKIPTGRWIGEKFITINNADGSVSLKLYINFGDTETWKLILDVNDTQQLSGTPPLSNIGNIGLRSDFMDIQFSNFYAISL